MDMPINIISFISLIWIGTILEIENSHNYLKRKLNPMFIILGVLFLGIFFLLITNFDYLKFFLWFSPLVLTLVLNLIFFSKKIYKLFTIGSLLVIFSGLMKFVSNLLSALTAFSASLIFNSLSFSTKVESGIIIIFKNKGVEVLTGCSGYEQLFFSIATFLIFYLRFPIKNKNKLILELLKVVTCSFLINTFRIFILSAVVFIDSEKNIFFQFLHNSYGSLFFSLLATYITCLIYFKALKHENIYQ